MEREGVSLVDPPRDLPREPGLDIPAGELFSDMLHFSSLGHRAMAELLVPALAPLLAAPEQVTAPPEG